MNTTDTTDTTDTTENGYEVSSLNSRGEGIIRIENKVCFIPFTAPGDIIIPGELIDHKSYFRATDFKLLKASPIRVEPPCPYFGKCGGCNLQHIKYSDQTQLKRDQLVWNFKKITGLNEKEIIVDEMVPSPKSYHYRNRAKIQKTNEISGFFKQMSHTIIPIENCLLLEKELDGCFAQAASLSRLKKYNRVSAYLDFKKKMQLKPADSNAAKTGFSQTNIYTNKLIKEKINTICNQSFENSGKLDTDTPRRLLDLYCGDGNLSLELYPYFKEITGIDSSASNIEKALRKTKELIKDSKIAESCRLRWNKADCTRSIKNLQKDHFHTIIMDPPKAGLKKLAQEVAQLQAKEIIYLSCDPATQATDLKQFISQGYQIVSITPFDMFPQTSHIENLVYCRLQ